MQFSPAELENIVRIVLQRLRSTQDATRKHGPSIEPTPPSFVNTADPRPTPQSPRPSHPGAAGSAKLQLNQRLITLKDLPKAWHNFQSIQAPAGAVITPAVRDELRQNKIQIELLERSTAQLDQPNTLPVQGLLLLADEASRLEFSNTFAGTQILRTSPNPTADAGRLAAHFYGGGQAAIWYSTTPFAAANAAAGQRGIRAVQLATRDDLPRAVKEVDPNSLIVDANRWSPEEVLELVQQWLHSHEEGALR